MSNALLRPYRLVALAVITATAAACATTSTTQETADPPTTVRGVYIYHEGAQTLHPCGSASTLWITGQDDVLEPLRTRSAARSKALGQPRQAIYAEVTGHMEPAPSPAYANTLAAVEATHLDDYLPITCAPSPAKPQTTDN